MDICHIAMSNYPTEQRIMGTCKVRNETERNETKPNETKRNQTKRSET